MSKYLRQNSFKFVRQESFNELHNSLFLFIGFQIVQFYFILPLKAGVLSISRSPIPLSTLTLPPPSQDRDTSHGLRKSFHEEPGISSEIKTLHWCQQVWIKKKPLKCYHPAKFSAWTAYYHRFIKTKKKIRVVWGFFLIKCILIVFPSLSY